MPIALEIDAGLTRSRRTSSAEVMLPESVIIRQVSTRQIILGIPICTSASVNRCSNWLTAAAVSVASDMTDGIMARFRTMPIARVSMLAGHVGRGVIQTVLGMAAVTAIALLTGFRATTSAANWLAAATLLVLFAFALTWLSVALGLAAKTVEAASNAPTPLIVLPFLGSGFVLTASMPAAVRWFAEYQPFTPLIDTVRGLLIGGPIGHNAVIASAWSLAIALGSYLWARKLFSRDPVRS
jgi:ABC-2 type transport system permease protein